MKEKYSKRKMLQFIAMTLGAFVTLATVSFVLPITGGQVAIWPPIFGLLFVIALNAGNKR